MANNKTPGFSTNNGIYPTVVFTYDFCDCAPNNISPLYTYIDHSEDDDYLDSHDDDEAIEIHIPNRMALCQLMNDICLAIHNNIQGYLDINAAPGDDTSNDIWNAIDFLNDLRSYDFK